MGLLVVLGLLTPLHASEGRSRLAAGHRHGGTGRFAHARHYFAQGRHFGSRHAWHGSHLQCVPFARSDSGIALTGNANIWWNEAAGRYERGHRPEPGSVLSFSANRRMRLGHVAVVSHVVSAREIEIDHANWRSPGSYGGVSRGVPVVDVSPENDWTQVRVALGNGAWGSVYRTHGFIYDRPDQGAPEHPAMVADNATGLLAALAPSAAQASTLTGTTGLQTAGDRMALNDEVAEAPDDADFRTARWGRSGRGASVRRTYRGWAHHPAWLHHPVERAVHHAGTGHVAAHRHTANAARLAGHHRG